MQAALTACPLLMRTNVFSGNCASKCPIVRAKSTFWPFFSTKNV